MSKTSLDKQISGRSAEVSNIRTKVWRRIQEETNVQFNSLTPYNLVQVKRLFRIITVGKRKQKTLSGTKNILRS
ncbi:hypothetical protein L5515_017282 [Caenorhabditis briggsae]|uniref:Uncharacterized protein n=1 Tax=Caenorhabditis briggsae TaxID=6238 RepID=A0AAE9FE87_CAEBR|nr:hypothetical protein L5515_017282 [Caenorhabditis briggsae]